MLVTFLSYQIYSNTGYNIKGLLIKALYPAPHHNPFGVFLLSKPDLFTSLFVSLLYSTNVLYTHSLKNSLYRKCCSVDVFDHFIV